MHQCWLAGIQQLCWLVFNSCDWLVFDSCDWMVFDSCNWLISKMYFKSGPLSLGSPVVVFHHWYPCFLNFNSTVTLEVGGDYRALLVCTSFGEGGLRCWSGGGLCLRESDVSIVLLILPCVGLLVSLIWPLPAHWESWKLRYFAQICFHLFTYSMRCVIFFVLYCRRCLTWFPPQIQSILHIPV